MRNTNPQNSEVIKTFLLIGNCGLEYSDEKSIVSDTSKSYLHLHIPRAYKIYILSRVEFNLSLLQDHVQKQPVLIVN